MRLLREVPNGARWQAAEDAAVWGYPRAITPREVEAGVWFADIGRICWFVDLDPTRWAWLDGAELPRRSSVLAVHGIAHPDIRQASRVMTPRTMIEIETLAQVLGARRLYSLIPRELEGSPMPIRAMRRYLARLGWQTDEIGCFVDM